MTVLTDDLAKFEKSVVDDRQAAVADFIEHIQSDDFYPSSVKVTETNEFHSTQEVSSSVELESESATERYIDYFDADEEAAKKKSESAAEKIVEEFPEMQQTLPIPEPRPMHKPKEFLKTYSFASLINESDLLQRLVELGVDLSAIERKQGAADLILKLDYDKHIKPILQFLVSIGIPTGEIGAFLTKNPWILQESIDDLKARINYLKAKNFSDDSIARIATKGIFWLNIPVKGIDQRLGFLQREFGLSGDEIRLIVTKAPKLITFGIGYLQMLRFTFHEELGFSTDEMKDLLIKEPKLWLRTRTALQKAFDYCHQTIGFSHATIMKFPRILRYPSYHVEQRHEFLKSIGRDQYDSEKPNYVSLDALVMANDVVFCRKVAKCSISQYNQFLKTR